MIGRDPDARYDAVLFDAVDLRRAHPSMSWLCEAVVCPHCKSKPGDPCRTKTGGTTNPHQGRFQAFREVAG